MNVRSKASNWTTHGGWAGCKLVRLATVTQVEPRPAGLTALVYTRTGTHKHKHKRTAHVALVPPRHHTSRRPSRERNSCRWHSHMQLAGRQA